MDINKLNVKPVLPFLFSKYIREYDISQCNINMLLLSGVINEKDYEYYKSISKIEREIIIGKMIKNDSSIYKHIKEGILKYRNILISSNNISTNDILSIKSDAIFIIDKILDNTIFDEYIEFKNKKSYTSFMSVSRLELYYNSADDLLDVKGISDSNFLKHENYFLEFLKTVFYLMENNEFKESLNIISSLYHKYINKDPSLDLNYYRSFDDTCSFKLIYDTGYSFDVPITQDRSEYDISKNIDILINLNKLITEIVLNYNRKFIKKY